MTGVPDSEAAGPRPPIFIWWAYRTVNGILVGVMLSVIAFWVMEGLGQTTLNWATAYAVFFGLFLALLLVLVLLIHAVETRTIAFLKWPFVLFVLMVLTLSVSAWVEGTR